VDGLSFSRAHDLFYEVGGVLYWKKRPIQGMWSKVFNTRYANKEAGGVDGKGYRRVKYDQSEPSIATHRVVFLLHYGFLPEVVDHIDGNKINNSIGNLRSATQQKNNYNSRLARHNTSGIKGVNFHKPSKRWRCVMSRKNKTLQVWGFDSKEDASDFMQLWREMEHGEFANHG